MRDYDPHYIEKKSFALIVQKAVVEHDGKILLLQRSMKSGAGGKWSLPGGALEQGEDPFTGILREIDEETRLSVIDIHPYCVKSSVNDKQEFLVSIGYYCKAATIEVDLNWEHDAFRWLAISEALEFDLTLDARVFLKQYQIKTETNNETHSSL